MSSGTHGHCHIRYRSEEPYVEISNEIRSLQKHKNMVGLEPTTIINLPGAWCEATYDL